MLKDIPLSKTLLLAIFAVVVGALALVQHNRAKQSGVRPRMVQFDEMLFRRMIAERKKNIEACERARGNELLSNLVSKRSSCGGLILV